MSIRTQHPLTPALFLAPAMLVLSVFIIWSIIQVGYFSLTRYTVFDGPHFAGLENYQRLLSSERFWLALGNSFLYLLVTPVLIVLSMAAALIVDAGLKWAKGLRVLLFLPVVTPTIVAAVAWRVVLREDGGLFNEMLAGLGIGPIAWLTERPWTLISPMLVTVWKGFGFYMMIFIAGLLAVPPELKEAASLDGAGRFGILRHVILPAMSPVIGLVFVISSIGALKVFDELYVTVKGVPVDHLTAVPLVYDTAFQRGDYGMASATGIALFLIILAFSLVNLRLTTKKERD